MNVFCCWKKKWYIYIYIRFGSGGGQENINAICILGLNMINDKVISIYCYHHMPFNRGF